MIVSQIPNKKIKDRREKLTENVKLYQAAESDIEEITGLYEQAKGSKFCTWDEHYPNTEITRGDLERDALFCMKTETGEIVGEGRLYEQSWPEYEEAKTVESTVEIAVQINGKTKVTLSIGKDDAKDDVLARAKEALGDRLDGKNIIKEIYVPGRIVNIVAK